MATEKPVLDRIEERLRREEAQRAEVVQRHAGELAVIDKHIAALQALVANWASLTPDQVFGALKAAGFNPRVDLD